MKVDSCVQPKNKKSHEAVTGEGSAFKKYQNVMVGDASFSNLLYFEFCIFLTNIPGAAGLFLRSLFWPRLFGSCGKGVYFGNHVTLRNPGRIFLGNRVVISDGCMLDARSLQLNKVIEINDDVILSNNVFLQCKGGSIRVGSHTGLGAQTIVQSNYGNPVEIGTDVFIGAQSYITGGGNYNTDRLDIPIWKQGRKVEGGTKLNNDIWLGAKATVLGGVIIGAHSIVAAGAVVTRSVKEYSVNAGIPARTIRYRNEAEMNHSSNSRERNE